jgi:hypothetical protein
LSVETPVTWFFGFTRNETQERWRWWHLLTGHGYSHVTCFGSLGEKGWLVLDWNINGMHTILADDAFVGHLVVEIFRLEGEILEVSVRRRPRRIPRLPSCVAMAKHLAGIDSLAITPQGLHRFLAARGARRMFETTREALHEHPEKAGELHHEGHPGHRSARNPGKDRRADRGREGGGSGGPRSLMTSVGGYPGKPMTGSMFT